jgi:hypothetical protein
MKSEHEPLDRLFKSAAAAEKPLAGAAVFALEARVMGAWRGANREEAGEFILLAWCRRATIGACMLALASLAWSYHQQARVPGAEMAIADSAMTMGVEP